MNLVHIPVFALAWPLSPECAPGPAQATTEARQGTAEATQHHLFGAQGLLPEDRGDFGLFAHQTAEGIDPFRPGALGADELPLGPPGVAQDDDEAQGDDRHAAVAACVATRVGC